MVFEGVGGQTNQNRYPAVEGLTFETTSQENLELALIPEEDLTIDKKRYFNL